MASKNTSQPTETESAVAEVMATPTKIDSATYAAMENWEDAIAAIQQTFGGIGEASNELGDGFAVVQNKATLIGVPLLLAEWTIRKGDTGDYVVVRALARAQDGRMSKLVITDGGSGILKQLREFTERTGKRGGLMVRNGLRESTYEYDQTDDGKPKMATTYYLDTSA